MKIKKYKSEIKFATIYSILLNLFVYIGIIFSSEINEMVYINNIINIYIFNNIYNKFNTIKELSFMKVLFYYIFL